MDPQNWLFFADLNTPASYRFFRAPSIGGSLGSLGQVEKLGVFNHHLSQERCESSTAMHSARYYSSLLALEGEAFWKDFCGEGEDKSVAINKTLGPRLNIFIDI